MATSWMRAFGSAAPVGTFWRVQFCPLSVERQSAPFQGPVESWHALVPLSVSPRVVEAQTVVVEADPAVAGSMMTFVTP